MKARIDRKVTQEVVEKIQTQEASPAEVPVDEGRVRKLHCSHPNKLEGLDVCSPCVTRYLVETYYPTKNQKENNTMKARVTKESPASSKAAVAVKETPKNLPSGATVAKRKTVEGRTLKLNVGQTWAYLFEKNENSSKRMTDAEITAFLNKEFPDKKSKVFEAVSSVRSKYNNGGFNGGVKPKIQSTAYKPEAKAEKAVAKKSKAKKAA